MWPLHTDRGAVPLCLGGLLLMLIGGFERRCRPHRPWLVAGGGILVAVGIFLGVKDNCDSEAHVGLKK